MSKVRVGIKVSVRILLPSTEDEDKDFATRSEWSYILGSRRVATTFALCDHCVFLMTTNSLLSYHRSFT